MKFSATSLTALVSAQRGFDPTESERVDNSVRRYFQLTTMMEHVNPEFDEKKYWTYGCNCLVLGKKPSKASIYQINSFRWPTNVRPRQRSTSRRARFSLQGLQGLPQVCAKNARWHVHPRNGRVQAPNHTKWWHRLQGRERHLRTGLVHVRQDVCPT